MKCVLRSFKTLRQTKQTSPLQRQLVNREFKEQILKLFLHGKSKKVPKNAHFQNQKSWFYVAKNYVWILLFCSYWDWLSTSLTFLSQFCSLDWLFSLLWGSLHCGFVSSSIFGTTTAAAFSTTAAALATNVAAEEPHNQRLQQCQQRLQQC